MLYWQLGKRVQAEVLEGRRAEYGARIVAAVGRQLEARYGRGFGEKNLRRMLQFAEAFPDRAIVAALWRQLSWAHFKLLIPLKEALKRDFYVELSRVHGWSTRELSSKIDSMLYERTALSKKPDQLIRKPADSGRWSCTSVGSTGMSASLPRRRRLESSCALAKSARPSSTSTSTNGASTSLNT